jgi:hypothetical protein
MARGRAARVWAAAVRAAAQAALDQGEGAADADLVWTDSQRLFSSPLQSTSTQLQIQDDDAFDTAAALRAAAREAAALDGTITRTVHGDVLHVCCGGRRKGVPGVGLDFEVGVSFDIRLSGFCPDVPWRHVRPAACVPERYPHLPAPQQVMAALPLFEQSRAGYCNIPSGRKSSRCGDAARGELAILMELGEPPPQEDEVAFTV